MKKDNIFWVGYSDLMTSLFFVMLVLFVVTIGYLKHSLDTTTKQLEEIKTIQIALQSMDNNYFIFDDTNKRYKLRADLIFSSNSNDIATIPYNERKNALEAGKSLFNRMSCLIEENKNVYYLLIIEGNTQRSNNNWIKNPDGGYNLSYRRALSLFNYWENNGINFRELEPNCEIILSGSGYFGLSRNVNEEMNRKFTIQITAKWKLSEANDNIQRKDAKK